jgi:hypothetical protein
MSKERDSVLILFECLESSPVSPHRKYLVNNTKVNSLELHQMQRLDHFMRLQ